VRPAHRWLAFGLFVATLVGLELLFGTPASDSLLAQSPASQGNLGTQGKPASAQLVAFPSGTAKKTPAKTVAVSAAQVALQTTLQKEIQPLLKKYCAGCHDQKNMRGGIDFAKLTDLGSAQKDREIWENTITNLQTGVMPPEEKPQPTAAEKDKLIEFAHKLLDFVDCGSERDPGRVTIRRLNRVEYNATVRDLLKVKATPADDFPSDDVGYGFDNIGDVLSMSPLLLERYLKAAQQLSELAIAPVEARRVKKKLEAEDMEHSGGNETDGGIGLFSSGEVFTRFEFKQTGEYRIKIGAWGDQAGNEPAKMELRLNGRKLKTIDVPATRNNPGNYEAKLRINAGKEKFSVAFINDYYEPKNPNPRARDRNLYIDYVEIEGPLDLGTDGLPESHKLIIFKQPPNPGAERATARESVERFAKRAYRRPVTPAEVDRLMKFFDLAKKNEESFEKGIQLCVQAALVSPHFLFRIEQDRTQDGSPHLISEHELATRLSYFLWSTMPDDTLMQLADQGQLRRPEVLEAQVKRMLVDPKREAFVQNFAGQWLQLRNLDVAAPNRSQFPAFGDELRAAMRKETELFFATIVQEDRSILDFLDADFTFVNEPLAKLYGLPNIKGNDFQRVSLTGTHRLGVLTQASVLTVTSNPTRTSPVKRGKWILENILGTPPPPPPPDVPELPEARRGQLRGTLRQQMEQHRKNPACASCHARMDPLGFGFENFDAIGSFRDKEGKFAIDPSGKLPDGREFQGVEDLIGILKSNQGLFTRCLTEKMLTYSLGRGLEYYDRCAVEEIAGTVERQQLKFSALVLAIVRSEPFQKRRGTR